MQREVYAGDDNEANDTQRTDPIGLKDSMEKGDIGRCEGVIEGLRQAVVVLPKAPGEDKPEHRQEAQDGRQQSAS